MATANVAGMYLLWKDQTGATYVLIHKRGQGLSNAGTLSGPGGGLDPAETPFDAAKRELLEESGIDMRADPESQFVWLGRSVGSNGGNFDFYARVYTGGTTPPVNATQNPPSHIAEVANYDFAVANFRGFPADQGTRHYWADLDQLLNEFTYQTDAYKPTPGASRITGSNPYKGNVRRIFDSLKQLSVVGAASYRPYLVSRSGTKSKLPAGTAYFAGSVPPPPAPPPAAPPAGGPPQIIPQPIGAGAGPGPAAAPAPVQVPTVLTDDSVVDYVVRLLEAVVYGIVDPIVQDEVIDEDLVEEEDDDDSAALPAGATPPWAKGFLDLADVPADCMAARFVGKDCPERFAQDRMWEFNEHRKTGTLLQTHGPEMAAYKKLVAEIKKLETSGTDPDRLEKLQIQLRKDYPDITRTVYDSVGPRAKKLLVRNPYVAHAERKGVSFANPMGTVSPGLQANIDLLKAVAPAEFIADKRASKLLLEQLWFCAKNPNGPACFAEDILEQLREYKAGKEQGDGRAAAAQLLTGPATDFGKWLRILKETATKK
jgi:8-oxo-dGTP pyrophosphatase MutT (NUDIX family)